MLRKKKLKGVTKQKNDLACEILAISIDFELKQNRHEVCDEPLKEQA